MPRGFDSASAEVYSDHSDQESGNIIDIDAVSGLGESAPTSLFRDRNVREGKAKIKGKGKEKMDVNMAVPVAAVKAEPMSPEKPGARSLDPDIGVLSPVGKQDDSMMSGDEEQDRDVRGRRLREYARSGGEKGVNEAQKVDLSESDSEEEEESMEGDFVETPGFVRYIRK